MVRLQYLKIGNSKCDECATHELKLYRESHVLLLICFNILKFYVYFYFLYMYVRHWCPWC